MSAERVPELSELLDLCRTTAWEVASELHHWRRLRGAEADLGAETKSGPTDVVTVADRMAEEHIRQRLMVRTPDAAWVGEETGETPSRTGSNLQWLVDPIDGTVNFLYDLPGWSVSIAASWQGKVVAGAVAVPTHNQLFWAASGRGARVREGDVERSLRVSSCDTLSQALLATGFAYDVATRSYQGRVVGRLVSEVRDIRRMGAASVDFCSVAAGRVDAYFERGLAPWDLAAGSLIASEAGAVVEQRGDGSVCACGPVLAPALLELLDENGAWDERHGEGPGHE